MDPMTKLHVLHALENGKSKAEVARAFGVHPRSIAYIFQQKDAIIRKYAQKYNALKEVHCINLDQILFNWLDIQIKSGNFIQEPELYKRAQDIISTQSNEDFACIDDWVQNFKKRHHIVNYVSQITCSSEIKKEWMKFCDGIDIENVYIGEMCGLYHSHTFTDFVNQKAPNEQVSVLFVVNCLGSDKQQLVVAGQGNVIQENVKSLPVNYFIGEKSLINYNIIEAVLRKWEEILKMQNRSIHFLVSDDVICQMHFININMINTTNMVFLTKCKEKIVECFKYNYRRLLIAKKLLNVPNQSTLNFVDYLHVMSTAWQGISTSFIRMLFFPPEDGSLYFESNDYVNINNSLSEWYGMQSSQFGYDCIEKLLEDYVSCDKNLHFLSQHRLDIKMESINEVLGNNSFPESSIPAFQAMKRLISYLQGENVGYSVMNAATKLENHLEHGSLLDLHNIYAPVTTNDGE